MAVTAPTDYNLDMNADYLDSSFRSPFFSGRGTQPWQVAYRPQISPDIGAENVVIKDSVRISASGAEALSAASAQPPPPSEAKPEASAPPRQIELSTERVRVVLPSSAPFSPVSAPAGGADGRRVHEEAALQALTTACLVNAAFDRYWQGPHNYRRPETETLTLQLQHPAAQARGPFYRAPDHTVFTGSAAVSADPDIIAHEQGHAILDSYGHYNTGNSFTASAHEAFADVTALTAALQSAQVREQVCRSWENGELSSAASVIGEGARELLPGASQSAKGLRDLAEPPVQTAEQPYEEAHTASQRFSHGVYAALHAVYTRERLSQPHLPPSEIMDRAARWFSADFVNLVRFLPRRPIISQSDLARALLQANLELHAGREADIYKQHLGSLL